VEGKLYIKKKKMDGPEPNKFGEERRIK